MTDIAVTAGAEISEEPEDRLTEATLAPLRRTGRAYYALVLVLLAMVGVGLYAYSIQLRRGLGVTGMAPTVNKIMWGLYITNFVFFIGISHAGTLISAILRVAKVGWRTPITRMAELITVVALMVAALLPIVDLGRPDRALNMLRYARWQSPLLWDMFAIATYFVGSLLYLYLPLIPDLASCRDRITSRLRSAFYRISSLGWRGTPGQRRNLTSALGLMMIVIIPVAVSVHTVVSWVFAMTLRTGWNTAVFGAYFVAGAIFSGIATLIVVMGLLRKVLHLEDFVRTKHFVNLGYLLAALGMIMAYFNVSEFLTAGYKLEGSEGFYLNEVFSGAFSRIYWFYVFAALFLPGLIVLARPTRRIGPIVAAALLVLVAMWLERYIIVVASLRVPQTPYTQLAHYFPTWIEIAITAGAFALFALIITLALKLIPLLSMWEIREQGGTPAPVATARGPAGMEPAGATLEP